MDNVDPRGDHFTYNRPIDLWPRWDDNYDLNRIRIRSRIGEGREAPFNVLFNDSLLF